MRINPSRLSSFAAALDSVGLSPQQAAKAMVSLATALAFTLERPCVAPLLTDANLCADALRARLTADPGRAVLRAPGSQRSGGAPSRCVGGSVRGRVPSPCRTSGYRRGPCRNGNHEADMTRYRTKDGDMLDYLCWKHYGRERGAVEAALEANPGLAELGPVFAAGIEITLPDLSRPSKAVAIRLWD